MNTKYQIVFLGSKNSYHNMVVSAIESHVEELGISLSSLSILDGDDFQKRHQPNSPTYCIYYGEYNNFLHLNELEALQKAATPILPVVCDLEKFTSDIPKNLCQINGYELSNSSQIEKLVGYITEGLGLLRLSRRLFISYKRSESSTVAVQLFEKFEKSGFDVFLDTHSIKPGVPFQDELWHRMADTDIVVILNTPNFLGSEWTREEVAKANSMSIAILQLVWPNHELEDFAKLGIPLKLTTNNFGNNHYSDSKSYLNEDIIERVLTLTESLRARSYKARQDNIITECISAAIRNNKNVYLHPEKFLTTTKKNDKEVIIIPTVGVPQAFTYNKTEELIRTIRDDDGNELFLLYDNRNIRDLWLKHLTWLDNYLPVKTIKIIEIDTWLKNLEL